jgi:hypothetical protein
LITAPADGANSAITLTIASRTSSRASTSRTKRGLLLGVLERRRRAVERRRLLVRRLATGA